MSSVRRAVDTRRVYAFITTVETNLTAVKPRSRSGLRHLLNRAYEGKAQPGIFFGKGVNSYYSPTDHAIFIARHQQDYATCLHEIVHAEGYWDHDSRFMRRYIAKLAQFARCDEHRLTLAAGLYGIKI